VKSRRADLVATAVRHRHGVAGADFHPDALPGIKQADARGFRPAFAPAELQALRGARGAGVSKKIFADTKSCHAVAVKVRHLYISPGHNFLAATNSRPGEQSAGRTRGNQLRGRTWHRGRPLLRFQGRTTRARSPFFALEVFEDLCHQLGVSGKSPGVTRRNVITSGTNLNSPRRGGI